MCVDLQAQHRHFVSRILRRTISGEVTVGSLKCNGMRNKIYSHEFVRRRVFTVTVVGNVL